MNKITTVQSRIDPELKKSAESILKQLRLTSSQAINALYSQIVLVRGLSFELKLPNDNSLASLQELNEGKGEFCGSFDEL